MRTPQADILEHVAEHDLVAEIVPSHLSCGASVARRIAGDLGHRLGGLVEVGEGEEAFSRRKGCPEPGVLEDHRSASRQIGCTSLAEPAGPEMDVLLLRDRQLPGGADDVVAIAIKVGRKFEARTDPPAVLGKQ